MPDRTPRGRVSFECKLARIEVYGGIDREEPLLRWRLVAAVLDEDMEGRGVALMLGTLLVADASTWGQALVHGILTRDRPFPSQAAFKSFVRAYGIGMAEELYDVARRAINVNTAMLDVDMEIPRESPEAEIEFPRFDELDRIMAEETEASASD